MMEQEQVKGKLRIYIDTSIVGGYFDEKFEVETKALFERLENKEVVFVISEVLEDELEKAPPHTRELLKKYEKENCLFEYVDLTDEADMLAQCYIREKVISAKCIEDCQHIAIATINRVDLLASWNFKHIVNLGRIKGYNVVNLKNNYTTIEIRTPNHLELLDYGNDND
jgi:predicted nucleic acid-binding protein